jgi:hypothetical protein
MSAFSDKIITLVARGRRVHRFTINGLLGAPRIWLGPITMNCFVRSKKGTLTPCTGQRVPLAQFQ